MLNADEKAELISLQRQALQYVRTDNWRDYGAISGRLQELTDTWRKETDPAHGTVEIIEAGE